MDIAPISAGNLSFRTKNGFIITGAGIDLNNLSPESLVEVVGIETETARIILLARGRVVPSRESLMHTAIYALKPGISAIFHTHDQSVLTHAEELKLPVTAQYQPAGSQELAQEVTNLLSSSQDINYIVLRNHGIIALGETLEAAGKLAESMNTAARNIKE
jgi:L-fuculose-phosphate aldolase